ncbi:MAG: hypothetical protein LUQ69_10200, partial [Methanoregulaceae archaeon]|nr:hypothetical protein [Methanoregulaceae archaeon]
MDGDGCDDLFVGSLYGSNYGGKIWCIFGTKDQTRLTELKTTFWDSYPAGGYYNVLDNIADFTMSGQSSTYMSQIWLDDFDGDGKDDVLTGAYYAQNDRGAQAGRAYLFYGRTRAEWKSQTSYTTADAAWSAAGEESYNYLGYYYYQTMGSGDFNNDQVADILLGAYGLSAGGASYCGGVYMILTDPPDFNLGSFSITDADGYDGKTVLPECGGVPVEEKETNFTGDGIYTFWGNFTDTWTIFEISEFRLVFSLKGNNVGTSYSIGYGTLNKTLFIIRNPDRGLEIIPAKTKMKVITYQSGEINISVRFRINFLSQDPFDVHFQAVKKTTVKAEFVMEDMLHLEKDLTFEGNDFKVTRDGSDVHRGDFISTGPPLIVNGLRVVHQGTRISPTNEKFFLRVSDNYNRIFEDRNSSGKEGYFEIPTSVASGIYKFNININIDPTMVQYMTSDAIIPDFYLQIDVDGPDRPSNLNFHADSINDPEGRWDNDGQVWLTWDPSYDSQQTIKGYIIEVSGPEHFSTYFTEDLFTELNLPGRGVFSVLIKGQDSSGNIGSGTSSSIVIDNLNLSFINPYPTHNGLVWFKEKDIQVYVTIIDHVIDSYGPFIDLPSLEYALTSEESLTARDSAVWSEPKGYNILNERKESDGTRQITISVPVSANEGKNNFIWFRVHDQAGNLGITTIIDTESTIEAHKLFAQSQTSWDDATKKLYISEKTIETYKLANITNPSNIWIDTTPLTFSDPTPNPAPLDENLVSATIIVNDLGSGVSAGSIQYSVSRKGIENYGGWTSIETQKNGPMILAQTVSNLLFEPGTTNYIRWRALDMA